MWGVMIASLMTLSLWRPYDTPSFLVLNQVYDLRALFFTYQDFLSFGTGAYSLEDLAWSILHVRTIAYMSLYCQHTRCTYHTTYTYHEIGLFLPQFRYPRRAHFCFATKMAFGFSSGLLTAEHVHKLSLGPVQRISILKLKQNVSASLSNVQPSHLQHL
jgi:hypothetical protein